MHPTVMFVPNTNKPKPTVSKKKKRSPTKPKPANEVGWKSQATKAYALKPVK